MLFDECNEDKIRYYDEINVAYGSEAEKEQIRQNLIDELSDFLSKDELEAAYIEETKDMISNKEVKVKLKKNYVKHATKDFIPGAIGVVHDWKYFRFRSYNWYFAYVWVDINGEQAAVNVDALEVLDEDFVRAEKNFFMKYKDTFYYDEENHELVLDEKTSFHCSSICRRILSYLDPDKVDLVTDK